MSLSGNIHNVQGVTKSVIVTGDHNSVNQVIIKICREPIQQSASDLTNAVDEQVVQVRDLFDLVAILLEMDCIPLQNLPFELTCPDAPKQTSILRKLFRRIDPTALATAIWDLRRKSPESCTTLPTSPSPSEYLPSDQETLKMDDTKFCFHGKSPLNVHKGWSTKDEVKRRYFPSSETKSLELALLHLDLVDLLYILGKCRKTIEGVHLQQVDIMPYDGTITTDGLIHFPKLKHYTINLSELPESGKHNETDFLEKLLLFRQTETQNAMVELHDMGSLNISVDVCINGYCKIKICPLNHTLALADLQFLTPDLFLGSSSLKDDLKYFACSGLPFSIQNIPLSLETMHLQNFDMESITCPPPCGVGFKFFQNLSKFSLLKTLILDNGFGWKLDMAFVSDLTHLQNLYVRGAHVRFPNENLEFSNITENITDLNFMAFCQCIVPKWFKERYIMKNGYTTPGDHDRFKIFLRKIDNTWSILEKSVVVTVMGAAFPIKYISEYKDQVENTGFGFHFETREQGE